MKKIFPLHQPGRDDARVRDKIRHEINKYVRRERQKPLPEGFDWWLFNCRVGPSQAAAETLPLAQVGGAIDTVARTGVEEIYVEIVSAPSLRRQQR